MTTNHTLLVVEDDEPKLRSIIGFLSEIVRRDIAIVSAESLTSAVSVLSSTNVVFVVVDMSIPTFDLTKDRRGGGPPQGFGGADILRFIDSETETTKSVVLTQYEEFVLRQGDMRRDPRGLEEALRSELDDRFFGVIHYAGQHGAWRQSLKEILERLALTEPI
ncbi:hypothetical protein [Alcaligenes faecalis]|uniref:Response regulator n=1 Tax=Alcaligenes faecalis TaxID=511 RepID=A0A2U2BPZ9_ALCFA|nr:hypothetical protein [Alcaligenes faecalis]PWE16078.1 hypothetical protein DF183_04960 [Alcaligenes faecalis]